MKLVKKLTLSLLGLLGAVQFIQPRQNKSDKILSTDITLVHDIPDGVLSFLNTSCFDCHSNNSNYPWYTYVQPVGWLINNDIQKGKSQLNLSEFGAYTKRRQKSKLISIQNRINDGTMPLHSYVRMHGNASLSESEKKLLLDWISSLTDSLSQN